MEAASLSPLIQHRITSFREFRSGLLELRKADLTPRVLSSYRESNSKKLLGIDAGTHNQIGHLLGSLDGIDDVDVLDAARDDLVRIVDDSIIGFSSQARVRPVLCDHLLKVKDAKLATLLGEFNAAKDGQPNLAAIGLRTILCLVVQERAKLVEPNSPLATTQDLMLQSMLDDAIKTNIFPEGEIKLLNAYRRHGLKERSDNVVHKPGTNMLVAKDDLSAAVDLLNKLIPTLI